MKSRFSSIEPASSQPVQGYGAVRRGQQASRQGKAREQWHKHTHSHSLSHTHNIALDRTPPFLCPRGVDFERGNAAPSKDAKKGSGREKQIKSDSK